MAVVRADVEVDFPSDSEENWDVFLDALRASPPEDTAGEPPRKRRKRSRTSDISLNDPSDHDYARIAFLYLRIKPPRRSRSPAAGSSQRATGRFPVLLHAHCEPVDADECLFELSPAWDADIAMPLRTSDPDATQVLRDATKVKDTSPSSVIKIKATFDMENDSRGKPGLEVHVFWRITKSSTDLQTDAARLGLLRSCFPQIPRSLSKSSSAESFYGSVHSPPLDIPVATQIQHPALQCPLYPFQRRAVNWLLRREGVCFQNGRLVQATPELVTNKSPPPSFTRVKDADGKWCFISPPTGVLLRDRSVLQHFAPNFRGGILAEEMGLGKTVELIALMCLHKRPSPLPAVEGAEADTSTPYGATLIITPNHILQQWINELELHAPHLRAFHYKGMHSADSEEAENEIMQSLLQCDVVLTTYSVLSKELYFATPPPDRNLRNASAYQRPLSPLVTRPWWRVCLDEAQMVESKTSNAAGLARLIPRVNAWSVSGTPIKKSTDDLLELLKFLQYEPFAKPQVWRRMDQATFKGIFSSIAIRHSKDQVRHELELPPQRRIVIRTPFTAVEEQHYSELWEEMCQQLGTNLDGSPASPNFNPESPQLLADMRTWLRRLRQTCLHPHVSKESRRTLGRGNGPLQTIGEVLERMMALNETQLRGSERELVVAKLSRAHVLAYNKSDPDRNHKAMAIYQEALALADRFVLEGREQLGALLETAGRIEGSSVSGDGADDSEDESETDTKASDRKTKLASLRKVLRSALEVQHHCCFWVGTAYYHMKTDEDRVSAESSEYERLGELETQLYARAKVIRRELLREPGSKAGRLMTKIAARTKANAWTRVRMIPELASFGIESRTVLTKLAAISAILDRQAIQIELWRNSLIQRLLKPLVDYDDEQETTGEEYEDSTKVQDEITAYMTGLRALVADRHYALTGQSNARVDQDIIDALRSAKLGEGPTPKLMMEIVEERTKLKLKAQDGSLRVIVAELRALASRWIADSSGYLDRVKIELRLTEGYLENVQRIVAGQTQIWQELEKEVDIFHNTMNLRIEYYRQLQTISDAVVPYKEEMDEQLDVSALAEKAAEEQSCATRLAGLTTRRNYLLHLRSESANNEEPRECPVCKETYELGVLTACGHQYCKGCYSRWWHDHRTCVVCRQRLRSGDYQDIVYKPLAPHGREEEASPVRSLWLSRSDAKPQPIYADISPETMRQIKMIDLNGSYGTKVDTLARHIMWLRDHDPGAKSIIFSQFTDFLDVLKGALEHFKIGYATIRQNDGIERFRKDASVECFLLDAKSNSSGLNLVNATYVFLCEPLINTALELQAVARVHRIGQIRPTTAFMYLVTDTVEETIHEISVQRRLEHIDLASPSSSPIASRSVTEASTPDIQESALDRANSLELQQARLSSLLAAGKDGGGEIVSVDDLWTCLFSKPRRAAGTAEALQSEVQRELDRELRAEAGESRRDADAAGQAQSD